MGFFDFFSGIGEAIGSFFSGVAEKIGSAISSFAEKFVSVVGTVIEKLQPIIECACKIISSILQVLGIKTQDTPEELGAKATQEDVKSREEFETNEDYFNYLQNEVKLDKERFKELSPEEKLACTLTGLSIESQVAGEKLGVEMTPEFVATLGKIENANKGLLSAEELVSVIKDCKSNGITNMTDVSDYFEAKGDSDRVKTGEVLHDAFENAGVQNPDAIIDDCKSIARDEN